MGTNLGNKQQNLNAAIHEINRRIGEVISRSAFYATAPWGFESANGFLNAALEVHTTLTPLALLQATQAIEQQLGRTAKSQHGIYADRLIDIDILLYDDLILHTPALTLPHPLMAERAFVLTPLKEIAPNAVHPVLQKTIAELSSGLELRG